MDKTGWTQWFTLRPWKRGRKRGPPRDEVKNLYVIDPDFDDDSETDCILQWRHELETTGAIAIHPDGDRRHGRDDPVPLHQRSYIGEVTSEIDRRGLVIEYDWEKSRNVVVPRPPPPPEPEPEPEPKPKPKSKYKTVMPLSEDEYQRKRDEIEPLTIPATQGRPPSEVLLKHMRLDVPIKRGAGRVWREWVMVNESDVVSRQSSWGEEVWRGRGFVLFKRPEVPGVEWLN